MMLGGLSKSEVNMRYMEWWKDPNVVSDNTFKRVTKGKDSKTHRSIPRLSGGHYKRLNASVGCKFV